MNGRHFTIALFTVAFLAILCAGRRAYGNEPPVADAGLPRYAATAPVTLDGTGSYDPDNSGPLTYAWRQTSGPPLTIKGADTATPTISGFLQTSGVQECVFELVVSDGELTGREDTTRVMVVASFGESTLGLERTSFDPNKPTFIYFPGGDCVSGNIGRPWDGGPDWTSNANVIGFPEGYTPDLGTGAPTYYRYADMIIAYLSGVAPSYTQAIQTAGHSTGGQPAIDVAIRLNTTYKDARYAVNQVTFLDATPVCRANYQECIDRVLTCNVDGERCWIDNNVSTPSGASGKDNVLNVWFDRGNDTSVAEIERHRLPRDWYKESILLDDASRFNHGVVAGAYWSVIGPGKNLQLASMPETRIYHFTWYGDAVSGSMGFYDEALCAGKLPEPVTLLGPAEGGAVGAEGAVFSCQHSQNAVRYQLLFGRDPFHMVYLAWDGPTPPDGVVTAFPFQETWWTIKAHDQYGSTIYADPIGIHAEKVTPQVIENVVTGQTYPSIQQAINDAHDGDEIVLGAGVCQYLGNLDFKGKSLTLRSSDPNDANVVGTTILAGDGRGPAVTLSSGKGGPVTLDGLVITGGTVAISCSDASPTIRNCTVESNGPVAIEYWYGCEPKFVDCTLLGQVTEGSDPRLIAHWKLDETTGAIAYDSAGEHHDATVVGTPLWHPESGKVGGALQLSGVPNLVMTKLARDPSQVPLSVFAWVKGGAPGQVIVAQAGGTNWLMARAGTGALTTELRQAGSTGKPLMSSTVVTDGNWHRVGLSWDGTSRILYVDDVEVAKDTQTNVMGSSGNLSIGAGSTMAPASFWKGLIDDVRVYDRAIKP